MNVLIFEWGAGTFTYNDIVDSFSRNGVKYRTVSYEFDDKNCDEFFEYRFSKVLDEDKYDAVFSVNYFPLVAKCCHKHGICYLSWSYDNPLDVPDIEKTLGYPENQVYVFDRIQAEKYQKAGFSNVFHLPLAVNTKRLDAIKLTRNETENYSCDIAFVGKMYDSMFGAYKSMMDEQMQGYVDALVRSQQNVYGYYFVDELLTDDILARINKHFKEIEPDTSFELSREALSYAIAAQITRNDRLVMLNLLSSHFDLKYYSWEKCDLLSRAHFMGSCDYFDMQPKVFMSSKVNLNITLKILQSGIPLRCMDILGAGGFLLSNYQPELAEYFVDGRDVIMYDSIEDAYDKASYYINHNDERLQIAKNGHDRAAELFSYDKQLGVIFSKFSDCF